MASQDSAPIVSPTGIIHVLGYTPSEGERGVPITVRIHFHPDLADAMYVRLVVGTKAVPTKVRLLPAVDYGRWQLHALAPPLDRASTNTKVLISVQALSEDNAILDSVTFGEFSYWAPGTSNNPRSLNNLPRLQIPDTAPTVSTPTATTTIRRRANSHMPVPSPSMVERSPFPNSPQRSTRLHRRMKAHSLVRTKQNTTQAQDHDELYAQTPILDLVTPLASVCVDWTQQELTAGRRLVRFAKVQDGRRLIVSCEPILQEEYCENDSVISCIYRAQSDTCYVTSVDVIYLLERLTNGDFPVEEKNRIRRNLEGLRPTTVSKHKAGFSDFFQRIMDFPDPKPRNIEKDLKVFEWNLLGQALEKILNKYSIYTSPPESTDSSPVDTPPASVDSPELYALQLSYPAPDEPSSSRFLDQKVPKFEPFPDEFSMPGTSNRDGAEPFPSPVDSVGTTESSESSPTSAFPLFSGGERTVENQTTTETHTTWASGSEFKSNGDMAMEHYTYEVVESSTSGPIHNFADNSGLDFNIYDNYGFQGIDDTLANLADPYNI
ncbi:hypothetical protein GALMADRAFT_554495 [Galerina marginata CBS 339.88]|uniref:DUF7082 domain-containing protein n=1 Tax=Galerina marginata (strain CBS 339.88) TaxID=685588 RepID=A0A067SWZ2_GALM3|nr:hypothetical protein GALMADRAFT_554495 [Galerina marginata CBS 339.88]